jgi:hypothetical protein
MENQDVGWWVILLYILERYMGGYSFDWSGSGYGQVGSSCECGNEPSGSIKCWKVLE